MMTAMLETLARMGIALATHDRIYAEHRARMAYGPCNVYRVGPRQGWNVWPVYGIAPGSWNGDPEFPVAFDVREYDAPRHEILAKLGINGELNAA